MKAGYIAWNESNCGSEFFGVYKNKKTAEWRLRRVVRKRFGRCPRDLSNLVYEPFTGPSGDDSYKVEWFCENDGDD